MKTLQEIEQAISTLPLPDRLRLYKDMPHLIAPAQSSKTQTRYQSLMKVIVNEKTDGSHWGWIMPAHFWLSAILMKRLLR